MENTISSSEKVPEFLYHYTTIETLAHILSTQKIRFNALNQVDDVMEGKSKDFENIGQYFLVSCWTDLEEESIPFWNMYSKDMKGIRLKFPSNLFLNNIISTQVINGLKESFHNSIVGQLETFKKNYWIVPTHNNCLRKVIYTNDIEKLYPTIQTINKEEFKLHLNVGIHKLKMWEFQSEWRFLLRVFPITNNPMYQNDFFQDTITSFKQGISIPFSDYCVSIDPSKFKQMEILLGPKHNDADKIIIESLISKYNPNAALKVSNLYKKIR